MGNQREFQGHAEELQVAGGVIQVGWRRIGRKKLESLANFPNLVFPLRISPRVGLNNLHDSSGQWGQVKGREGKGGEEATKRMKTPAACCREIR